MKIINLKIIAGGMVDHPGYFFRNFPEILNEFSFVESKIPDYVIYCAERDINQFSKAIRISYAREYSVMDMHSCDWGLGWQYPEMVANQHRYIRFPNYTFNGAGTNLIKGPNYDPKKILEQKTKFCAFVYAHTVDTRVRILERIGKYKQVDSPGLCCNNAPPIGKHLSAGESRYNNAKFYSEKVEYLKQFKFTIAFENRSAIGYTSEKIYNAMQANSIPIYWGNPLVYRDFNPKSFINSHDQSFKNEAYMFDYLMQRLVELDRNDDKYLQILKQPWYHGNVCSEYTDRKKILDFFCKIFNNKK